MLSWTDATTIPTTWGIQRFRGKILSRRVALSEFCTPQVPSVSSNSFADQVFCGLAGSRLPGPAAWQRDGVVPGYQMLLRSVTHLELRGTGRLRAGRPRAALSEWQPSARAAVLISSPQLLLVHNRRIELCWYAQWFLIMRSAPAIRKQERIASLGF